MLEVRQRCADSCSKRGLPSLNLASFACVAIINCLIYVLHEYLPLCCFNLHLYHRNKIGHIYMRFVDEIPCRLFGSILYQAILYVQIRDRHSSNRFDFVFIIGLCYKQKSVRRMLNLLTIQVMNLGHCYTGDKR